MRLQSESCVYIVYLCSRTSLQLSHSSEIGALGWVPGSGICLYQETLYRSVSCRRRLRRTALCGTAGWPLKLVKHITDATGVPPSPAGPPGYSLLHILHLSSLSFIIGMPNRSCILKFSVVVQSARMIWPFYRTVKMNSK